MLDVALDVLLLATGWTHVLLAPFTKVEESFNLHATHDVLMYGIAPSTIHNYDHFTFPGAVPRTFVGSILLAWISTPLLYISSIFGLQSSKLNTQIIIRLVLATANAYTLCLLKRATDRRFGRLAAALFTLITCTQFHVPFWMGRTLPNMFALIPTNIASYLLMNRGPNTPKPTQTHSLLAISLLTFTAIVFRAEVALLLAPLALQYLLWGAVSLPDLVKIGGLTALASVALTTLVDSYIWQQWPLWPEFHSVYFNVIQGKNSEWGVSPYWAYLVIHLPKVLMLFAPLSIVGFFSDSRIRSLLLPPFAFILLLSTIAHKEWRFIVYVVPWFNIAAARGATALIVRKGKINWFGKLCILGVAGTVCFNLVLACVLTRISMENYPGGRALVRFNQIYAGQQNINVHLSNLAAQSGASLFLQDHKPPYLLSKDSSGAWTYDKTENLTASALTASDKITHLIAECPIPKANQDCNLEEWSTAEWKPVEAIKSFSGWTVSPTAFSSGLLQVFDLLVMVKNDALVILERQ